MMDCPNDCTPSTSSHTNTVPDIFHQPDKEITEIMCHRCKKKLPHNETINNEKAGAPIPEGETDYDYCWDCFAILHDIGFTEDHYDTEDESMIVESDSSDAISETSDATIGNHSDVSGDASSNDIETINNMHQNETSENIHDGDKGSLKYECCNQTFLNKRHFTNHNRLFHGEEPSTKNMHQNKTSENDYDGRRFHHCKCCNKTFLNKRTFTNHNRLFHGERAGKDREPCVCKICSKTYANRRSLQVHERLHTRDVKDEELCVCKICNTIYANRWSLKVHEQLHTRDVGDAISETSDATIGNHSDASSSDIEIINMHQNKTSENDYDADKGFHQCECCNKTFLNMRALTNHNRLFHGEKPNTKNMHQNKASENDYDGKRFQHCKCCNKTFSNQRTLTNHIRLFHGEKPRKDEEPCVCKICNRSYCNRRYLKIHERLHSKDSSNAIHVSETSDATIGNHSDASSNAIEIINMHQNETSENKHGGDKVSQKYECCNKTFLDKKHFTNHNRLFHGEKPSTDRGPPYVCTICCKNYASKRSLRVHKQMHDTDPDKKFLCSICSRVFNWKKSLEEHELRHWGKFPLNHECEECGKKFPSEWKLKQHERIHTGEKPFLCSICGKGFNQKVVLKAHERVHKGVMPFPCKYCDKRFVTS
ncbi:uncharacterized protein [Amphiura filiformis]|uniref:uncharacterized protein n=1 Tax=Amphiura filiformis TaxID=82378 RepID=UPI003B22518A